MVLVELLIIIAGVAIVIITVYAILTNPNGPPVAGPCKLVTRPVRKDYCSGTCASGQTCLVTGTKPWALFGTQARTCACGTVIPPLVAPPGSVPGVPPTSGE